MDLIGFFSRYWYAIIGSALVAAFLVYHHRHRSSNVDSATTNADEIDSAGEKLLGMLFFVVTVVAFIWDRLYGYRVMGLGCLGFGLWAAIKRRIAYGLEGKPPIGYISGVLAVVVGVAIAGLGLLLLLAPDVMDQHFASHAER
jgi:hypothetical protein